MANPSPRTTREKHSSQRVLSSTPDCRGSGVLHARTEAGRGSRERGSIRPRCAFRPIGYLLQCDSMNRVNVWLEDDWKGGSVARLQDKRRDDRPREERGGAATSPVIVPFAIVE